MKLLAHHGYGDGMKIKQGLEAGLIDGVIYSPKDIGRDKLAANLQELVTAKPESERLFDPQFYATLVANAQNSRCGTLITDYSAYFSARRRSQLEAEARVQADLRATLGFVQGLDVSAVIAPNVLVQRSLDSIEAVIAKNFVRHAKAVALEMGEARPVYATLALSCETLRRPSELVEFLTDLTLLELPPDGFYLLIGAKAAEERSEIYHADTLAGWFFLNYTLSLNGYRVINGFSDIVTPFLGICGASAGATGWWSNLRTFSLSRFAPDTTGGRLPTQRYLSCALLNRITFDELEALRGAVPEVLNGLPTDTLYPQVRGSEPERNQEVQQSWAAIRHLNDTLVTGQGVQSGLAVAQRKVADAQELYAEIQAMQAIRLDPKSDDAHLAPLGEALELFADLAEIDATED